MYNKTTYLGRLTKDLELKETNSGTAVIYFTLAVQRSYKNAQGTYDADFINCVAYDRVAENMAKFLVKGSRVLVEGEMNTWNTKGDDGNYTYHYINKVNNATFLDTREDREQLRKENSANEGGYGASNPNRSRNDYNHQRQQQNVEKVYQEAPKVASEDDLPF